MSDGLPIRYGTGSPEIAQGSVPVTVIVLSKDEEINILRCIRSVGWANQVLVVDSGSQDHTVDLARSAGAQVIETSWRGFGPQREWAMQHDAVRHDWVYFVDADEWVSVRLAKEIVSAISHPSHEAYAQQFRLVFQGRWIRHCGWYPSVLVVRLVNRKDVVYGDQKFSEHPIIAGTTGRLANDIIDEDQKGLARWLHKHVDYAVLEATRRAQSDGQAPPRSATSRLQYFLKYRLAPRVPARPLIQFLYMYVLRRGFLDGRQGLLFCSLHAWFQMCVQAIEFEQRDGVDVNGHYGS